MIFISDYFCDETGDGFIGGAELNDLALIQEIKKYSSVFTIKSERVNEQFLDRHKRELFVISNFSHMPIPCLIKMVNDGFNYVIYEHDHKYLRTRNPTGYPDMTAPPELTCNIEFYRNAKAVFLQSNLHQSVYQKNTGLTNCINVAANFWTDAQCSKILNLSQSVKSGCGYIDSDKGFKNSMATYEYIVHTLHQEPVALKGTPDEFLEAMSKLESFVFLPKIIETFSRICAEAKMLGCKLITRKDFVGFLSHPELTAMNPQELVDYFQKRKTQIAAELIKLETEHASNNNS